MCTRVNKNLRNRLPTHVHQKCIASIALRILEYLEMNRGRMIQSEGRSSLNRQMVFRTRRVYHRYRIRITFAFPYIAYAALILPCCRWTTNRRSNSYTEWKETQISPKTSYIAWERLCSPVYGSCPKKSRVQTYETRNSYAKSGPGEGIETKTRVLFQEEVRSTSR